MQTQNRNSGYLNFFGACVFIVFGVLNITVNGIAQPSHVLIVEDLKGQKKPRVYYPKDYIVFYESSKNLTIRGYIHSITDSSLMFYDGEILLRNIEYVTDNFNRRKSLKDAGMIVALLGTITTGIGLGMIITRMPDPEGRITPVLASSVLVITGLGYWAATTNPTPRRYGQCTGWRIRIKRINL